MNTITVKNSNEPIETVEYDLSNVTVITKYTMDRLLKEKKCSNLIALYTFYIYTATWQNTNQPKCTKSYIAKGLNWSETKVARIKSRLVEMKLIENIRRTDEKNVVTGWYVKVNYFTKPTIQDSNRVGIK